MPSQSQKFDLDTEAEVDTKILASTSFSPSNVVLGLGIILLSRLYYVCSLCNKTFDLLFARGRHHLKFVKRLQFTAGSWNRHCRQMHHYGLRRRRGLPKMAAKMGAHGYAVL